MMDIMLKVISSMFKVEKVYCRYEVYAENYKVCII